MFTDTNTMLLKHDTDSKKQGVETCKNSLVELIFSLVKQVKDKEKLLVIALRRIKTID